MKKLTSIFILIVADISIVVVSLFFAILIKNDWNIEDYFAQRFLFLLVLHCGITIITNSIFNCYNNVWAHAGATDMVRMTGSITTSLILTETLLIAQHYLFAELNIELLKLIPVVLIAVFIELFLMSVLRFSYRIYNGIKGSIKHLRNIGAKRILIVGGSENHSYIIDRIFKDYDGNCKIVAVLCEDKDISGLRISGVDILFGNIDILDEVIEKYRINEVVVGEKVINNNELRKIYSICNILKCEVKLYSGIVYLTEENFLNKGSLRHVKIEDLLGRNEIIFNNIEAKEFIRGKVIFVTGGAGSIGSEICRQVLDFGCKLLIAFDIHENGLFELENELLKKYDRDRFIIKVGSIRDSKRFDYIFSKYPPQIVFHAAAHKHVPLMEKNPGEAIKNNVFGTNNVAAKVIQYNVENFILISTDKAVNPTNIMGASKRIAELLIKTLNNNNNKTKLSAVRFGNVLGSNGSVIPTFRNQIEAGGPVTVTHPEITRYFMTIPEAVTLVLQAGHMSTGGEIFELDMGEPIKIYDLACEMIKLSGYEPETDIKIEFSGLRPGEKLFEELSLESEILEPTSNDKIFICKCDTNKEELIENINKLRDLIDTDDRNNVAKGVKTIVNEYETSTFELDDKSVFESEIELEN